VRTADNLARHGAIYTYKQLNAFTTSLSHLRCLSGASKLGIVQETPFEPLHGEHHSVAAIEGSQKSLEPNLLHSHKHVGRTWKVSNFPFVRSFRRTHSSCISCVYKSGFLPSSMILEHRFG
jgi:hypothetical protein